MKECDNSKITLRCDIPVVLVKIIKLKADA